VNPNSYEVTHSFKQKEKLISRNTDKIVLQKFNREFEKVLKNIIEQPQIPLLIDSYVFTKLMIDLGCAKTSDMEND